MSMKYIITYDKDTASILEKRGFKKITANGCIVFAYDSVLTFENIDMSKIKLSNSFTMTF